MGVEVLGIPNEGNGYGDTMDAFRNSHFDNSRILLNLAMGRKKNAPTPPYDPEHPDNAWPVLMYHSAKGEKLIGTSLVGLTGQQRKFVESENLAARKQAEKDGYRAEPYQKPQVVVLDPAAEKKALLEKNQELEGKLVAQGDQIAKMQELLEKLAAGAK